MESPDKEIKINVREIVLCNEEEKSFCDVFVYEPENIEEQALGNLYIIGEITNFSDNSSYLANLLASIIKKEFYSKPKRPAIESLEAGLHKANMTLSDLAEQGNVDWIGNLSMACGAYKNKEFHFSQVGKIRTLLIRDDQITDIGKNINKEEKPHPFRTFTNIASGELEANDLVLFTTPELFNIFSLEKMRQMSSSFDIEELAAAIQDSIEQEKNISAVALLIMKIEKKEREKNKLSHIEIKPALEKIQEKEASYNIALEEKIEEAKTEIGKEDLNLSSIDIRKKISLEDIIEEYEKIETEKEIGEGEKIKAEVQKPDQSEDIKKESEKDDFSNLVDERKPKANILDSLSKILSNAVYSAKDKFAAAAVPFREKIAVKVKEIVSKRPQIEAKMPKKISFMSNKNKFLVVAFALVFFILAGNLIFTGYKKKEEEKLKFYSNMLSQTEEKINKAEEVLIYNDLDQARALLAEAKNIALEVNNNYKNLSGNAAILLNKIQNQLDVVDIVHRIDSPKIAVDLDEIDKLKNSQQIIKIEGKYYIFTSTNNLYQLDFENKKANNIELKFDDIGNFKLSAPVTKTGEIIFLTDSNKIAVFDTGKNELDSKKIEFSSSTPNIKDISTFNNYVYLLEIDSNQIYKHQILSDSFGKGKSWITDPEANIKDAVSIAIDGFIYVLKSNGAVEKYLTGGRKDFSIEKPSDPISNPTKIYTRPELKYLYIIEPTKNRIMLFDKSKGKLIGQYISEDFDNLKSIVVDDKEEKMYVLNGTKVFEIEL